MLEIILAVDSLAIQRSLTILEDRYRELRESGEKRFEAWEKESADLKQQLTAQADSLQQAQKARDEQAAKLDSLEANLASLKDERDAATNDKDAALKANTDLKQQLTAQADSLQQAQKTRDDHAAKLKTLEGDLATLKGERDAAAKEKATAQQSAAEFKQQLTAQAETLQQAQKARDDHAAKLKTLEGDLVTLNTQQSSVAAGLQRLRHLAHPAGKTT